MSIPKPVAPSPRRRSARAPEPDHLPHLCTDDTCPGARCMAIRLVLSACGDHLHLNGLLPKVKRETLSTSGDYDRADLVQAVVEVWALAGQPFLPTDDAPLVFEG